LKAAPFEYERASTLAHACALLAQHGADAKLIAGGQSLVPMMAMRLTRPALLIDLNDAAELQKIAAHGDHVCIGATVRQARLAREPLLLAQLPLLVKALKWVGHAQTRNRGTPGGSIVHADPSAEIPLVACTLAADLRIVSRDEESWTPAADFFLAPMVTAIAPEQCLAEIRFPVWREARVGCAFHEVSIRHGDFALVSACAQIALDEQGNCTRAAIGVGGAGPVPQALAEAAQSLIGTRVDEAAIMAAATAAADALDADGDLHASAAYRKHLAQVLVARALREARGTAS
jgi:CO/xanthine dehydrogenase FAD-binding subunit